MKKRGVKINMSKKKNDFNNDIIEEFVSEKWVPIKYNGKETKFLISTFGRVANSERCLIKALCRRGRKGGEYKCVRLWINGKVISFSVHRLVAEAFIPNPENKPQVNHIDGNKFNNKLWNLEWVTQEENMRHAIATGLMKPPGKGENARHVIYSPEDVHKVCKLIEEHLSISEIAKRLNVSKAFIKGIRYNGNWEEIRSKYEMPETHPHTCYTKEQIDAINFMLDKGIHNKAEIIKETGLPDNNTTRSYIKYRIRIKNRSSVKC